MYMYMYMKRASKCMHGMYVCGMLQAATREDLPVPMVHVVHRVTRVPPDLPDVPDSQVPQHVITQ